MTDIRALVEAMRREAPHSSPDSNAETLLTQAADALERLAVRVEELELTVVDYEQKLEVLAEQRDALREDVTRPVPSVFSVDALVSQAVAAYENAPRTDAEVLIFSQSEWVQRFLARRCAEAEAERDALRAEDVLRENAALKKEIEALDREKEHP